MQKTTRSQFVQKLHETLQRGEYLQDFRWCTPDTFEITVDDVRARRALSPSWDFRSLSSFIRQLSYYGFKRLSDRRRSVERRTGAGSPYIVFAHPSGFFIQDDASQLDRIVRKTRARKASGAASSRRKSSETSSERSQSPSREHLQEDDEDQYQNEIQSHQSDLRSHAWAPPPQHPGSSSAGRQKPSLHLHLQNDNFSHGVHQSSWGSRTSPYPTPLRAPSPVYSTSGQEHGFYSNEPPSSFYQHAPYPNHPHDAYSHNGSAESLEIPHHHSSPHHPSDTLHVGAVAIPPSPTDSQSYGSLSPRNSEPEDLSSHYDSTSGRSNHAYYDVKREGDVGGRDAYYAGMHPTAYGR
ncbi:hypothetical protein P7C70_g3320, partial [Phenoliferia sp. Uapishka_3]